MKRIERPMLLLTAAFFASCSCYGESERESFPAPSNLLRLRLATGVPIDESAEALLRRNGFVVLDRSAESELTDCYSPEASADKPTFVTTDAMLQVWYGLHQDSLKATERESLYPRLRKAIDQLVEAEVSLRSQSTEGSRAALRKVGVLLAVAQRLLNDDARTPSDLRGDVDPLVAKVMAHVEWGWYPAEDYTQYTVRGHYTDHPDLSRYFRASMWLSRRFMEVPTVAGNDPNAPLRQAVALAAVVRSSPEARINLLGINQARQFLAGPPNSISADSVLAALDRTFGRDWTLSQALQAKALSRLRQELSKDYYPESVVAISTMPPGVPFPKKIVTVLPSIAIPDSVLFQKTVNPAIPLRSLPTGLEVGAALGSEVARQQIQTAEAQSASVLAVVNRFTPLVKGEATNVYDNWLKVLATLFKTDPRAPAFMRRDAWQCEKLNTCLGSWSQQRHNYILYAAQAHAGGFGGGFEQPPVAIVEPNPPFYRALADLARKTRAVLESPGGRPQATLKPLPEFEGKCREFEVYAEAELQQKLTREQGEKIGGFGSWLRKMPHTPKPLVADVATGMKDEVLHVATGYGNPLLVIPNREQPVVYLGWVMNYYEFDRPPRERLTDQEWKGLNDSLFLRPERPEWTREFVCVEGGEEWKSRAPLREGEKLFAKKQDEDALALLRNTVSGNKDSPLATEAQYRIGKYFYDAKQYQAAQSELAKCRRMYGCDASDSARSLEEELEQSQDYLKDTETPKAPQELPLIRALIAKLGGSPQLSEPRLALEKQLLALLLGEGFQKALSDVRVLQVRETDYGVMSQEGHQFVKDIKELLRDARTAFRCPEVCEVVDYLAATNPGDYSILGPLPAASYESEDSLLRYARRTKVRAFQAVALAQYANNHMTYEDDTEILAMLRPYNAPGVFDVKNSPELALLMEKARQRDLMPSKSLEEIFKETMDILSTYLSRWAYLHGQFSLMVDALTHAPHPTGGRNGSREFLRELYEAFSDFERKPLELFVQAVGLETLEDWRSAGERFLEVQSRYPTCKLAPFALWRAGWNFSQVGDSGRRDETYAVLAKEHSQTFPAPMALLCLAYYHGDRKSALEMLPIYLQQAKEWLEDRKAPFPVLLSPKDHIANITQRIQEYESIRKALQPIAATAGRPDLVEQIPFPLVTKLIDVLGGRRKIEQPDLVGLGEKISTVLPERAAEIYLALTKLDYDWELPHVFLDKFPQHVGAESVRWQLATTGYREPGEGLAWIAGFLNDKPEGEHYKEARQQLEMFLSDEETKRVRAKVRQVAGAYPNTRTSLLAQVYLAKKLVDLYHPEEALKLSKELLDRVSADDPVRVELTAVIEGAEHAISMKHQPEKQPATGATENAQQ